MLNKRDHMLQIFLCHASADKPIVRELYRRLKIEKFGDIWLDEENLLPGQDWKIEIEKAVESADVVIVCLSDNSVTKEGFIQKELRIVLDIADEKPEETIFVIPLRLNECEVPRRLKNWQYVDYFPEGQKEIAYGKLLQSLDIRYEEVLGKETEEKVIVEATKPESVEDSNQLIERQEGHLQIDNASTPTSTQLEKSKPDIIPAIPTKNFETSRSTTINLNLQRVPRANPIFHLAATLVSNELFLLFTRENQIWLPTYQISHSNDDDVSYLSHWVEDQPLSTDMKLPVINLNIPAIKAFLKWLGKMNDCFLRLPTVHEWEVAATAGRTNWFEEEVGANRVNYHGTMNRLSDVDGFGANPFGIHDLLGNAYDLCIFSERGNQEKYILMGGCYESTMKQLRERKMFSADVRLHRKVGFRYVLKSG